MDPQVTLTLMLTAMENEDREALIEHAEDLEEWIRKEGFVPLINRADFLSILNFIGNAAAEWMP